MRSGIIFSLAAVVAISVGNSTRADEKKLAEQGSLGQSLINRYDTNGNGKIDPEESEAAKAELSKRRGGGRGPNSGEKGPGAGKGPKGKGLGEGKGIGQGNGIGQGKGREALLKKFDANGNGQLDPPEREAAKAAMEKNRNEKGKGKNGKGKGKGKQARAPADGAMRAALLQRFDANGNGQLEPEEMEAAKAEFQKLRGNQFGKK